MHEVGFYLRGLTLQGDTVEDARVDFDAAFGLVVGPSDTGKSYILQCIDFMLGAGKAPKKIPESAGYERARLDIVVRETGQLVSLERSLQGGAFKVTQDGGKVRRLREKHDSSGDRSVSNVLLGTFGVSKTRVRANQYGETNSVTFRDFSRLVIVDENAMFSDYSPALSGQYGKRTVEVSAFRFVLTSVDDSSVIRQPRPEIVQAGYRAQRELLVALETEVARQTYDFDIPLDRVDVELERVTLALEAALRICSVDQARVAGAEQERRAAWREWRKLEGRRGVLEGLLARFTLLGGHYASDIQRLEAIAEADYLLEQYPTEVCPVCGALPDCQPHREPAPATFQEGCIAEAKKLRALAQDLSQTVESTKAQLAEVLIALEDARVQLNEKVAKLADELEPRARKDADVWRELHERRNRLVHAASLSRQLASLGERRAAIEATRVTANVADSEVFVTGVPAHESGRFCLEVEAVLRAWEFPGLTHVAFDDEVLDIVVSGRARASHGKGVRAVLHAAFAVGLMRYCVRYRRPHPGVVVLDSPLVAYREPKNVDDPDIGPAVKEAFYRSLANNIALGQVIVLENEEPPDDLKIHAGVVRFTKDSDGRYGFLPVT